MGKKQQFVSGDFFPPAMFDSSHVLILLLFDQQMRRSGNKEENKRILMDLDVVLKSHDCPYIVQCFGTFITNVSSVSAPIFNLSFFKYNL